jgi:hypothetical protein
MPDPTKLDEWKLRIEPMRADLENKQADTRYKITLTRVEPWKVIIAAVIAAAAIGGLAGYKLGSMPPEQIIIQQPAAK